MLHFIYQLVANFVCLPLCGGLLVYSDCSRAFSTDKICLPQIQTRLLGAVTELKHWSCRPENKNTEPKEHRCLTELREQRSWVIILSGVFAPTATTLTLTQSHMKILIIAAFKSNSSMTSTVAILIDHIRQDAGCYCHLHIKINKKC